VFARPASAQTPEQRGDVAVGYVFMHETGLSYPLGIALSDAWRVARNVDLVAEGQFEHGSIGPVGVNISGFLGGVRGTGGSRYGDSVSAFGQLLAGVGRVTASYGFDSFGITTFVLQPGFGVEVPVTPVVAIRPQFDVFLAWPEGESTSDLRFSVNAVFRLFKKQ
jgi:hypothetical protein